MYSGLRIQVYLLGRVSTAIFDEVRTGVYGTVVIGRRGERKAFFMGSVAMRLVQKVSGQALWAVP